jgi:diaminopimelate epimerase
MQIEFYKYQGTGNDFVIIDNRSTIFPTENRQEVVYTICHRRFGIGADGLILLENSDKYDFKMLYFNADGNESTMCGNGGRCIVAFANYLGVCKNEKVEFEAIDGLHTAEIAPESIKLQMKNVSEIKDWEEGFFLDTGSPHLVKWVYNAVNYPVLNEGKELRHHPQFGTGGTNVNFVSKNADGTLFVRTFERGVEDETYSCGTGVTAVALVASKHGYQSPIVIHTQGGILKVYFTQKGNYFTDIILEGPTKLVFKGIISI